MQPPHLPLTRCRARVPAAPALPVLLLLAGGVAAQLPPERNFEQPPVHGLAVSPDGARLYAVQPAAGRLVSFSLARPDQPVRLDSIPVGLEPVSVRLRNADEAWVVERLSDAISIVSLRERRVVAKLRTADEPADVVFAGSPQRAFVSSAGEDLVQVFDPATRREIGRIPIFGQQPTALAVDPGSTRIYVAVHQSGNGTTVVPVKHAPPQPKPRRPELPDGPAVPLIVAADDPQWAPKHGIQLPDIDVVEIDPHTLQITREIARTGTINFGLAVHPQAPELWIANTQAHNLIRFEPDLRARFVTNRVTRVDLAGTPVVTPVDLNPGVDYTKLPNPQALAAALAQPTDAAFSPDGSELWVAAFGTDRIGVLDRAGRVLQRIEVGDTPGTVVAPRTKRGPRNLAWHPTAPVVYVLAPLSGTLITIDARARRAVGEIPLGLDPLPQSWREGRGFLYDAKLSGNGLVSCASCHVDARRDGIAWDLGDPYGRMRVLVRERDPKVTFELHPMKGPLLTQTLIGLRGQNPFHWRGDRDSLADFNPTFASLLGGNELEPADLSLFLAFLEGMRFGPNPNQNPDRTYTDTPAGESARDGQQFFLHANFSGATPAQSCVDCHARPSGSSDEIVIGRESAQYMITQHLRDLYTRTGRRPVGQRSKSGFGILHGGHENGVFEFLSSDLVFLGKLRHEDRNKRMLERFLLEFDTGTAPAVGRTLTVTRDHAWDADVRAELALLTGQVAAQNVGLIAHAELPLFGRVAWSWDDTQQRFVADRQAIAPRSTAAMLLSAWLGGTVTFTGVLPGTERQQSIDRNLDGVLDGDEGAARYGPATPRCAPDLELDANDIARIGDRGFALVVRDAPRDAVGLLLLAAAPASIRFQDLRLHVDPAAALVVTLGSDRHGVAAAALPIPADRALVGQTAYAQALFAAPCGRSRVAGSPGLRIPIRAE